MSDVRDPDRDQQLPVSNDNPSCHDLAIFDLDTEYTDDAAELVVFDLIERKVHGLRKYQSLLQPFNGRNMTLDAYEESLDLVAYLRGVIYEIYELEAKNPGGLSSDLETLMTCYQNTLTTAMALRTRLELMK